MRKFIPTSVVLCAALMVATVVACRSDELAVRVQPRVEQRADSFSLSLDLGNVPFETRITATQPIAGDDDSNKSDKSDPTRPTRAALVVGQGGKTTINLTLGKKKDVDVFLILRNGDGSRLAVANSTWSTVEGETTKLKTNGQYTFTWVKGSGGALVEDEMWYLDAMTGGEWDATTKAYNINKACALPRRMFNPGESVELGEDIHVPFGLGTNALGSERKWGVRMYVVNGNREAGGYTPRLVCLDPEPSFSPYGSLLCMRFRTHVTLAADTHNALEDPEFRKKTKIAPNNFSYYLRGVSVESTSSTTGGCIKMDELSAPTRELLPWHPYTAGIADYVYDANHQTPFKAFTAFDIAQSDNLSSGYFLSKAPSIGAVGKWTPYYYLWVKSLDESLSAPIDNSQGLKVRYSMYNHTLKPDSYLSGSAKVFSRVFVASKKVHKSGHAYFANKELNGEVFMPAVFYVAPDIIYERSYGGTKFFTWPDSIKTNFEVKDNTRWSVGGVEARFSPLSKTFNVNVWNGDDDNTGTATNVNWQIPSRMMLRSVFPSPLRFINKDDMTQEGFLTDAKPEEVNINGHSFRADSYYFNPWSHSEGDSQQDGNYHVFYALKFVGTPYCEVVRYTLFDRWKTPESDNYPSNNTRFVIHSKHLGDVSFANKEEVRNFFENVVVGKYIDPRDPEKGLQRWPKPSPRLASDKLGVGFSNEFWGNFWYPDASKDVTMRVLHVPGPRIGDKNIGRTLVLGAVDNNQLDRYEITDNHRNTGVGPYNFTPFSGDFVNRKSGRISILPFIAPEEYTDPPTVGEHH